jgi:DnaJ-class molecular chaperone
MAGAVISEILGSDNFFTRLGLPAAKAAPDDVRKQYRRRALQCHPDKSDHPQANAAFQALSEAFDCLHDSDQQKVYMRHVWAETDSVSWAAHQSGGQKRKPRWEQRAAKRATGDGSGGGSQTWYQRARSWADIERELLRREEVERQLRVRPRSAALGFSRSLPLPMCHSRPASRYLFWILFGGGCCAHHMSSMMAGRISRGTVYQLHWP